MEITTAPNFYTSYDVTYDVTSFATSSERTYSPVTTFGLDKFTSETSTMYNSYLDTTDNITTSPINVTEMAADVATMTSELPHTSYVTWQMGRWILLVYRPLCGVTGVVGNIMTLVVVLNSSLRSSPTSVYMIMLAILDCVLSCVGVLHVLPTDAALGEEHVFTSTWRCRAFYFILLFSAHWNTLTLVAMTGQRYVAIGFPFRAARWNTRSAAIVTVVIAALISFAANWAHLILYQALPFNGQYRSTCSVPEDPGKYWVTKIYPWVDWTLYSFLPLTAIFIINLLIHRALATDHTLHGSKTVGGTHGGVKDTGGQGQGHGHPAGSVMMATQASDNGQCDGRRLSGDGHKESSLNSSVDGHSTNDRHSTLTKSTMSIASTTSTTTTTTTTSTSNKNKSSTQVTRMLVTISVAFLIFTLPIGVFVVVAKHWNPVSGEQRAFFSLVSVLSESLMYTNHAVNFILYCLSGSRFRQQAAAILCRCFRGGNRSVKTEYSWA